MTDSTVRKQSTQTTKSRAAPNGARSKFDLGSFVAGVVFMALGLAFVLEAQGQWAFRLSHFRYIGPLILIVIGISILAGAGLHRFEEDHTTPPA